MKRIKEHIGEYFAVKGTKKQLLKVEKELKKLGCFSDEVWNCEYRKDIDSVYIHIFRDKEYLFANNDNHPNCKIIIELSPNE